MSRSRRLFVVVVGCGQLGAYVANRLSSKGHSLVVVDNDEHAFEGLSGEYSGFRVEGDATEFRVLKEAKTDKADLVLAVTYGDNINLMVAQVAKKVFNVKNVIVRVNEPTREQVYRDLGIDTICPNVVTGDAIALIADTIAFSMEG